MCQNRCFQEGRERVEREVRPKIFIIVSNNEGVHGGGGGQRSRLEWDTNSCAAVAVEIIIENDDCLSIGGHEDADWSW